MSQELAVCTPRTRSRLGKALAFLGVVGSIVFLLNFTVGIFEIPDNLPVVGNLDEVAATALLLTCLRYLGHDVLPFKGQPCGQ